MEHASTIEYKEVVVPEPSAASESEEDPFRHGTVRGVFMDRCGTVILEVFEPATSLAFEIRHGFDEERGINFLERRRSMYGRGVLFQREELRSLVPGYLGKEIVSAAYVFKGFEPGDDL